MISNDEKRIFKVLFSLSVFWFSTLFLLKTNISSVSKINDSINLSDILTGQLLIDTIIFFSTHLFLHALFGGMIWLAAMSISRFFNFSYQRMLALSIYAWIVCVYWVLLKNAKTYELSEHHQLVGSLLNSSYSDLAYQIISTIVIGVGLFASLLSLPKLRPLFKSQCAKLSATILFTIFIIFIFSFNSLDAKHANYDQQHPNVIIIGIDSLRPDYLNFDNPNKKLLEIEKFITTSTWFSQAITPFARTLPSWVGVLSGQHPKNAGVRYNLIAQQYMHPKQYLGNILKKKGYTSIFAMDEMRFANIDESYGFDKIIGPKMGAGDFLLSSINDIPLSNLLSGSEVYRWLFPYSHINRAAHKTYIPEYFDQNIAKALRYHNSNQPLFLVAHFCLLHWPYTWSEKDTIKISINSSVEKRRLQRIHDYRRSISKVDEQFKSIMHNLNINGLLDNAIVILISDHGESHGESFPIQSQIGHTGLQSNDMINQQAWGHGTSIIQRSQHHVLLSINRYRDNKLLPSAANINKTVSLLDIFPTLLDSLNIDKKPYTFDGISLWKKITQPDTNTLPERIFFVLHLF